MTKRYFTFLLLFIFLIIISTSVFSISLDIDPSKDYYFTEDIDLKPLNLQEEVYYFEIVITSQEGDLFFKEIFLKEEDSIIFRFDEVYPSNLILKYTFFSYTDNILETKDFSLNLKSPENEATFYFCKDFLCEKEVFNPIPSNQDFYIFSNNNQIIYQITISSEDVNFYKEVNSSLPYKLNLQEGVYDLKITSKEIFPNIDKSFNLLIEKESFVSQEKPFLENLEDLDEPLEISKKEKSMFIYIFLLLIILLILYLLFKGKRKPMIKKQNLEKKSRRELRKISLIFIFLIIFSTTLNASILDQEYQFSFFTDDYQDLLNAFPQEKEINLYISDIKKTNSVFVPLISYNLSEGTMPVNFSVPEGVLEYENLSVLFAVDVNKSKGNYAAFLPKETYPKYCEHIIDYFHKNPILTKSDLINRNKHFLINQLGFSRECVETLIDKSWIQEKQVLSKITYAPFNYDDQSKIIQTELSFPRTVLSNEKTIIFNIIKNDSAVVYAYPNPLTYDDLFLETFEKGWHLSDKVSYTSPLSDLEEVYRLNLNNGKYGSFILSLENYTDNYASFNLKFLNQDKKIIFNDFLTSSFISFENEFFTKNIISKLTSRNDYLVLNNFDIFNFSEKRKRKVSPRINLDDYRSLYSRRDYTLFQTPFFDQNKFSLSLSNGVYLNPIIKDNFYLFYNFDNGSFGDVDIYIVESLTDTYYFTESIANYKLDTYSYILGNDTLNVKSITTSEEKTSFEIYFKEEDETIRISSDRKNIVFTEDPNFYIFKNYLIVTLAGDLRVYLLDDYYHSFKKNTFEDYSLDFEFLAGKERDDSSLVVKNFTDYVYDISTANDLSDIEKKLFWAKSYGDVYNLKDDFWFFENHFLCSEDYIDNYNLYKKHFEKTNFTILKYPGHFNFPFSEVLLDKKNYVIERNSFSQENYSLLCNLYQEGDFRNYSSLVFKSAMFLEDQENFIDSLYYLSTPINQIYDKDYNIKYLNEYFSTNQEGIVFFDKDYSILGAVPLDFKNNYFYSLSFINKYLIFDRLSYKEPINLVFDIDKEKNNHITSFIKTTYFKDKEKLSLNFKLPKRKSNFTDGYIKDLYLTSSKNSRFRGNCSYLSMHAVSNYNFNNVKNMHAGSDWWLSDFRNEDAWFLGGQNQVIWNYKKDPPINSNRLFEGLILGVYIGSTQYTYSTNNPLESRAGKTFTGLLYTHALPYIDNYLNSEGIILNAGSSNVYAENVVDYYSKYQRQLREIIVPRGYYDDSFKDKYGRTELDYVKEYLTSFD